MVSVMVNDSADYSKKSSFKMKTSFIVELAVLTTAIHLVTWQV